jgi:hypothetical protein
VLTGVLTSASLVALIVAPGLWAQPTDSGDAKKFDPHRQLVYKVKGLT